MAAGADLGLDGRESQSVLVICHSTYEPGGGEGWGRHMCRSTYVKVNINRLLIIQSLH